MNAPRCPICATPLATGLRSPLFPFCSRKCKLADLSRWLDGDYRISEPLAVDGDALTREQLEDLLKDGSIDE